MRDPILFGDFRMALHEEETRIYEDIQDYEAAKALFQVRGARFSREHFWWEPSFAWVPSPGAKCEPVSPPSGSHIPQCMGIT